MPLQDHMKLISVDDHLIEHPMVWEDRLPAAHREAGPRIVEIDKPMSLGQDASGMDLGQTTKKAQVWFYEGRPYPQIGLNAVAGRPHTEYGMDPIRYDEMLPGCYDPKERLADMDLDGVHAAMCFPSFPRFAGTVFLEGQDKELARLCVEAYNDFVLDEWCAPARDRYIPVVILPVWDQDACVREVHRTAAKGAKVISFPENPVPLGLPSIYDAAWTPVFKAVEETGMPLGLHFGTSGRAPQPSPESPIAVMISLMSTNSMQAVADLLFSPVFHRHPNLRIMMSEGGIGWAPFLLERCEATWTKHRWYQNIDREIPPSELFRRHITLCFIDDQVGIEERHRIGIGNITWECDYPHSDSNWPGSRKRVAEMFQAVPDDEVHRIVELNAREVLHF